MNNRTSGKQKSGYIDSKSGIMVYFKLSGGVFLCVKMLQNNLLFKSAALWYNLNRCFYC